VSGKYGISPDVAHKIIPNYLYTPMINSIQPYNLT